MRLVMTVVGEASWVHRRVVRACLAIFVSVALTSGLCAAAPATGAGAAGLRGVHVFGWALNQPSAVASDGTHVWVANAGAGSVVEFNASNGRFCEVDVGPELPVRQSQRHLS